MTSDRTVSHTKGRHLAMRALLLCAAIAPTAGCTEKADNVLLGETEYAYVSVPAEASERIVEIAVQEGQQIPADALIARLDDSRLILQIEAARAVAMQADAVLLEASHGARSESIDAARAAVRRNQALWEESHAQLQRAEQLRQQQLIAQQALDSARANEARARADRDATRAELDALLRGTRVEQIAQAQAAAAAAQARVRELELVQSRYQLRAPRAGTIDALPFEVGDRPPLGAVVARISIDDRPYVRTFVPASRRAAFGIGDRFDIQIAGSTQAMTGSLRSIANEPAYTPYYALVGDDASKLVFRAEIALDGDAATGLAAGLPATLRPRD